MKRNTRYEVLAPAGSIESMKAAVAAGADAVYMGGVRFGARAYADNPEEDMLLAAIDFCHLHGVRLFMTVNTLLKEQELSGELIPYLMPYVKAGVDAFIVQDPGVWECLREAFPEVPLHASTQMTITGPEGAKAAKKAGAARIVTARELSVPEIRAIHEAVDVEIETFVHGAICYCYSGQCLYSSLIGGRSGNRGRCAQPCRLPYELCKGGKRLNPRDEAYPMNLKDMCALDVLPDLLEAGVYSLKIEGRMKSPRYTAGVVSIYRKYVDLYERLGRDGYRVDPKDRELLLTLFDRGGQTDGYFKKQNGRDMIALWEKPDRHDLDQSVLKEIDEAYVLTETKEKITGKLIIRKDLPVTMELSLGDVRARVKGACPMPAEKRALTEAEVRKQFSKFGQTSFLLTDLSVELEDGLFLTVGSMNELRRSCAEKLTEEILRPYRRSLPEETKEGVSTASGPEDSLEEPFLSVLCEEEEQFQASLEEPLVDRIYLSMEKLPLERTGHYAKAAREAGKEFFLALPRIYREKGKKLLEATRDKWDLSEVDGYLVRVVDELSLGEELSRKHRIAADHSLYTYNRKARGYYRMQGFETDTVPIELNARDMKNRGVSGSEILIYGHLPMMVSAQCFHKTMGICKNQPGVLELRDRKHKNFPVKNYCSFCYNVIYNTDPLCLFDELSAINSMKPAGLRLQFSVESGGQVKEILKAYGRARSGKDSGLSAMAYTKGHFRRGVE